MATIKKAFNIKGGRPLQGTIYPQGAKNEALQVICACLLTEDEVKINNIPNIEDVKNLIRLLKDMGVEVHQEVHQNPNKQSPLAVNSNYTFRANNLNLNYIDSDKFVEACSKLRGSVLMLGPLLARNGRAVVAKPGGDKIGRRRLDTHILGFKNLKAKYTPIGGRDVYELKADRLVGCNMLLDEASVTGTANIIMASVQAKGKTTIYNAACEPYVQQLCRLLINMGAKIDGVGTNRIEIEGVKSLHGAEHTVLADMIEVGSFIGMAAMVGNGITIKNVKLSDLGIIPSTFKRLGIKGMKERNGDLFIPKQKKYKVCPFLDGTILTISDAPWPGLTPDLISVLLVVATQAKGTVLFHQKMFESRLFFVDKLIDMGAQIILCDPHRAVVVGHNRGHQLKGGKMSSPDIRAGIALLIAALSAEGESYIANIEQIDRGYERIEERLNALGADITREEWEETSTRTK